MYLALDDTDSVSGMCTTFLATEILERSGLDMIGYPKLVRLNPNIRYKTRGNGAIVMRLGHGSGNKFTAGRIDGRSVEAYTTEDGNADADSLIDIAAEVVREYAVLDDPKTNPGIVVSDSKFPPSMYSDALSKELNINSIEHFLAGRSIKYIKFKQGRGIIGSASALAWDMNRVTYELLAYRYPTPEEIKRETQMGIATFIDEKYPGTFNNVDMANRHAAIFPSSHTPVVYGIRSTDPESLILAESDITASFKVSGDRYLLFATNQGTDDHIVHDPQSIWEYGSFSLKGRIEQEPYSIQGGHYFSSMEWKGQLVKLAAFEPTKEFRTVFRSVRPGDQVEAVGSYSGGAIKVEKLFLLSVSRYFRRVQPECPSCGKRMKTHGRKDFRCRECGTRSTTPGYSEEKRSIRTGGYEVPVSARRHLSMPLKLQQYFSPAITSDQAGIS